MIPDQESIPQKLDSGKSSLSSFCVYSIDLSNGLKDIKFEFINGESRTSDEELKFKNQVENTLHVISTIYRDRKDDFNDHFDKLLPLTQVGLVGRNRNTTVATHALNNLQQEILSKESGNIKNKNLFSSLKISSLFSLFFLNALVYIHAINIYLNLIEKEQMELIQGFLIVSISTPLGVWMSFATRKINMTFKELIATEDDNLNPFIKLVFTVFLAITFCLLLNTQVINFEIGGYSAAKFTKNPTHALLLGILLGLSEKILPTTIMSHVNNFLSKHR